jgi:hypothetical protein
VVGWSVRHVTRALIFRFCSLALVLLRKANHHSTSKTISNKKLMPTKPPTNGQKSHCGRLGTFILCVLCTHASAMNVGTLAKVVVS